jgi:desulfoferrodoxin-like iron-binding protein
MAVEQLGEIYFCKVCGNVVEVIRVGGGTLVCCDQNMERKVAKSQTITALPENLPDSGV